MLRHVVLLAAATATFGSNRPALAESEGPYTAMAYRVGEVTQTSAIVWSRLTARFSRDDDGRKGPDVIGLAGKKDNSLPETFLDPDGLHGNVPGMAGEMRVAYIEADKMDDPGVLKSAERTPWVGVNVSTDFAHNFPLTGLKPGTKYFLKVEARRQGADQLSHATSTGSFTTPASPDQWQDVLFTVITGKAYRDLDDDDGFKIYHSMLNMEPEAIGRSHPHFLVLTGDTVYLDNEAPRARTVELARYHWRRMNSLETHLVFHQHVPGYWQKDDHDLYTDDVWPGKKEPWMLPFTFDDGFRLVYEQNPVPHGPAYRTIRWGSGLQIWLTEGRDHRSPNRDPDGPDKTIWGKEQREWLMNGILESDAKFKVLISPTPIVGPDRPRKADNHSNDAFAYEGNLFRDWTAEKELKNFYVCCGDRHWQYYSVDPKTGLREFSCGPVSDEHAGGSPGHNEEYQPFHRVKGGYLSVFVTRDDDGPLIAFRFHDVEGNVVYEKLDRGE